MDKETIIEQFEDFLNEYGLFYKFKDFINDRGYTVEELGIREDDDDY